MATGVNISKAWLSATSSAWDTHLDNAPLEFELEKFLATVFQHEFDHLDGRLYIDRITDPTRLAFEEAFERYILPET